MDTKKISADEYWLKNGYAIVKLSRKDHNKLLPTRIKIFKNGRYFLKETEEKRFAYYTKVNILGKLFATIALPIAIIIGGVINIKEIWQGYLSVLNGGYSGFRRIDNIHLIDLLDKKLKK
jgi:hypothetical protein